ncbi:centrosomal protein of 112 kDa isoform X6 [Pelmatolapia mariae]|uniref:centrosomal protein of 112 kDa isoform X6 n=1 Tax=Pelmatolapia mariae TaxID=158779 RepID=UPI002FE54B7E
MSKYELSSERLDTEFDHFLLDMKPYVLKHPSKTERQRCAQWIKKLCDPATCGSGLIGRKNRNMYARLLLQMLKRGVLDGPFTSKPEPGSLKTLPAYMSIYFDEPLSCLRVEHGVRSLPDWVTGELSGCSDDSLTMDLLKDKPSSTPVKDHHRRRPYEDRAASRPVSSSPLRQSPRQVTRMVDGEPNHMSPDDSDLEARLNSWNLGIEKPRYLREEPVPLSPIFKSSFGGKSNLASDQGAQLLQSKETEMKIKVLEAKHQEEKLKMQQRHDAEVEKILDRKNGEIEEMKSLHRTKQKESEETIRKLEKKVQSVLRESQVICESKEKQIAELKKMSDQSADSLKNEWEKKLHAAVTEMEQEKFELQKKHTQNIQELLEDTNVRLAKMESDYNARSQATEQTMRELELRVKQQSAEVEKGNTLRQKVTQEKAELEIHIASISTELQEANRRIMILQKEKEELSEQHEQATQKLQVKYETDLSHLHHEHALSAAKASEVMADLEKTVAQIKQQLEDSEHRRHQQVRDQEMKVQQEKDELLISCEKKVLALQTEAEKEKAEAKRKIAKLEEALREKESQLDRARESQRQHIQQADMALEQFKKQMAEQRMQHEQERTRLQQQHSAEKDSLVQEHQREVSSLERQARAALQQHQQHTQEWRKRDAQTIADLEAQLSELREELKKAHAQHKQQLAEMALLQEEEKQRATLDKRASLDRLERNHQQEKDAAHEKGSVKPLLCLIKTPHLWATTNSRLKQIEREYSQKLAKSAQLIAELQTSVCDSKEEAIRLQTAMEKQLKEANARWEEERKTITHRADQAHKALQEKVESLQRQLHSAEKNLLSKELETEEKVTMVHKEYEEKIKGLMPVELRQELEDTISSLKAQVNFLQMRASLLQEDLDACRSSR